MKLTVDPDASGKSIYVSPRTTNVFVIAAHDAADAIRFAPLWLRQGWIAVVRRYRRTFLGPFWHTLGLAAFVIVMGVIWSTILNQDTGSYFRYVTVSLMTWTLISSMIVGGAGILIGGRSTALSMRFPYIAFAFGHVWQALLLYLHHFILYIVVMAGTQTNPGAGVVLAVPAVALVLANGIWMSLLAGVLCLRHRDLVPLASTGMQIMMFVTPVFWPKTLLGPELAWAADYNPLHHMVQIVRGPLLGSEVASESWLWCIATLIVGTVLTMAVYGRYRRYIAYWY